MKRALYLLAVAAAILAALVIYGQHVDAVNREESRQAWTRAEQQSARSLAETQATSACLNLKIRYTKQGVSLEAQKLRLEERGFNLDCSVRAK